MIKRNTETTIPFALISATDGSAITSGTVTVYVSKDGGAQAESSNSASHLGNGQWAITLTATEMDAGVVGVLATHASAVPAHLLIPTTAKLVSELQDPTVGAIADQVWDESLAGHAIAQSAGAILSLAVTTTGLIYSDMATASALTTVGNNVDAILVDTDTTLPAQISGLSIPTASAIRTEIDTNSTQLAAIVADTNELQAELADGGRTDLLIDAIKAKTDLLSSGTAPTLAQSLDDDGAHLQTVRGDSYEVGSPRGAIDWIAADDDDWPDLTGATVLFTSRNKSTDVLELAVEGEPINPTGPSKTIRVELTAAETNKLTPSTATTGVKSNKFDVQVTLATGKVWTPIRGGADYTSGGHTIYEDQSR